jgi:hypothetical protein
LFNGKGKESLTAQLIVRFISVAIFCDVFINFAFFLVYTPLNVWWGFPIFASSQTDFLRWTEFTLHFYLALLPFLVTANVGLWWFMQILHVDPPPKTNLLWGNIVGIGIAFPLLMQLPFFVASMGFDLEFAPLELSGNMLLIFLWTVLIYLLLVSALTASHPLRFLKQLIFSPFFWLVFILLCVPAYAAFLLLVLAFPVNIPLIAVPLALIISALLLCFTFPPFIENRYPAKK